MSIPSKPLCLHSETYDDIHEIGDLLRRQYVVVVDEMVAEYKAKHARELTAARKRRSQNGNSSSSSHITA